MSTNDPSHSDELDAQSGSRSAELLSDSNGREPSNLYEPTPEEKSPLLPQISSDSTFSLDLDSIISAGDPEMAKINKRASSVQKLAQENEKLKAELKEMSDRLDAAERKRMELERKKQSLKEPPSE